MNWSTGAIPFSRQKMPKSAFNKDGAIKEKRLLMQEFCYSATVIFLIVQIFPNIHQIYISVDTIFFVLKVLLFYLRGAFSILSARKFEVLFNIWEVLLRDERVKASKVLLFKQCFSSGRESNLSCHFQFFTVYQKGAKSSFLSFSHVSPTWHNFPNLMSRQGQFEGILFKFLSSIPILLNNIISQQY